MTRKLAHVEVIENLTPIVGADLIETAHVLGWQCVVKKGEFNVGDKVVYIEVDSILPEKPEYEFLRERNFRIRTIRLRKQISQGLVLPLSALPNKIKYSIGQDVTGILGIVKYESPSEVEERLKTPKNPFVKFMSRFKWFRKLFLQKPRGSFPSWIKKTDEERIQNMPKVLLENSEELFEITEKLDGMSATYFLRKNGRRFGKQLYEFGVCSRNLRKSKPDNSAWWKVAQQENIEQLLKDLIGDSEYVVLQGEIVGTNNGSAIQKNKYQLKDLRFFAFNLFYPNTRFTHEKMVEMLEPRVWIVPLISVTSIPNNVPEIVEWAKGNSMLNPKAIREGIVVRSNKKQISFKVINPDFLLKNDE